jgi:hypothetical protein
MLGSHDSGGEHVHGLWAYAQVDAPENGVSYSRQAYVDGELPTGGVPTHRIVFLTSRSCVAQIAYGAGIPGSNSGAEMFQGWFNPTLDEDEMYVHIFTDLCNALDLDEQPLGQNEVQAWAFLEDGSFSGSGGGYGTGTARHYHTYTVTN